MGKGGHMSVVEVYVWVMYRRMEWVGIVIGMSAFMVGLNWYCHWFGMINLAFLGLLYECYHIFPEPPQTWNM